MSDKQAGFSLRWNAVFSIFSLIGLPSLPASSTHVPFNMVSAEQQTWMLIVFLAFVALATILVLHHRISTR